MKKYILVLLIIFSENQFVSASQNESIVARQNLVDRWKNAETMVERRNLLNGLTDAEKERLLLDLIDAHRDKFIQSFKENNFLYLIGNEFYKEIIRYSSFLDGFWSCPSVIQELLNFFNVFYTVNNMNDMHTVVNNVDQYYSLLQNYAQTYGRSLREIADKGKDIIELLQTLLKQENNDQLPGNFAKADSFEQKALKKYLLQKDEQFRANRQAVDRALLGLSVD
ncbi:hypothetical protein KBB68_00240 [Candidatus Babeliales bacterium]|nr:hypothetical protein [Candidatus Babeliales bacterium]